VTVTPEGAGSAPPANLSTLPQARPDRDRHASLAKTLVRLKLRLMANRAKRSSATAITLALASLTALGVGVLVAWGLTAVGWSGDVRAQRSVLVLGVTAMTIVWVVFPLVSFGTDETLDPNRLALFPLEPRRLLRGLLLTAFVGPAPTVALFAAAGAIVGYAGRGGIVIVIPAAVLALLLAATLARTVTTLLASALSSRRGRDAAIIVASLLAISVQGVRFIRFNAVDAGLLDHATDIARWTPPGMLAQAVIDARAGHWAVAVLQLVPALVLIPLLLAVWARALERSMTVVLDGSTPHRKRRSEDGPILAIVPSALPFLARYRWGAATAKELRYLAREPRRKVTLINATVIGVGIPVWFGVRGSGLGDRSVLLATAVGYLVLLGASNQFGLDGPPLWMDVVAGDRVRDTIIGKNVAMAIEVLPIVLVAATVVAALTGGWAYLPAAVLLAAAGLGAGLAIADVMSVRFPVPLPQSQSPFAGRGGGQGCATSAMLLVGALVQNVLLVPIVAAAVAAAALAPVALFAVVPLSLAYGAVLWWAGVSMATRWASGHQPELLAAVDNTRAA
jgi:ABC-2 type transport system permease protein